MLHHAWGFGPCCMCGRRFFYEGYPGNFGISIVKHVTIRCKGFGVAMCCFAHTVWYNLQVHVNAILKTWKLLWMKPTHFYSLSWVSKYETTNKLETLMKKKTMKLVWKTPKSLHLSKRLVEMKHNAKEISQTCMNKRMKILQETNGKIKRKPIVYLSKSIYVFKI